MKNELIKILAQYIILIDSNRMSIESFRKEFDDSFEKAMNEIIHPYGREEFKSQFFKG